MAASLQMKGFAGIEYVGSVPQLVISYKKFCALFTPPVSDGKIEGILPWWLRDPPGMPQSIIGEMLLTGPFSITGGCPPQRAEGLRGTSLQKKECDPDLSGEL